MPATQSNPGQPIIVQDMGGILESIGSELSRFSGKTVLITGAAGMLPGYLADTLAYANTHFLDRSCKLLMLTRSHPKPYSRLAHLVGRDDVEFIVQDVCSPLNVEDPIHFIIHAASAAAPDKFLKDPVSMIDANSVALRHLLESARQPEFESFLFFSSSEIYGNPEPENIPTPENYVGKFDFTEARSFYAEAKRFGETLCAAFYRQYGVPVKVVRPFHIHGPGLRLDDGRIVAAMIAQGINNHPFEILSDGKATRTYGYVSDATVAFLKVLLSDYNGEAFNVGANSPETSILELATMISHLFGKSEAVHVGGAPNPKGSPQRTCPDLSKIGTLLNYSPRVSLEDGLRCTILWLRAQNLPHEEAS